MELIAVITNWLIRQHFFRYCLGVARQQAITLTNVDQDLCHHMVSQCHNETVHICLHFNHFAFLNVHPWGADTIAAIRSKFLISLNIKHCLISNMHVSILWNIWCANAVVCREAYKFSKQSVVNCQFFIIFSLRWRHTVFMTYQLAAMLNVCAG